MDMNMMMIEDDGEDETNSLTNFSILAGRLQSAIVNGSIHHLRHYLFNEIDRNDPFWNNPDDMNNLHQLYTLACEESDYQGGSSPEMLRLLYQEGVDVQEPFEDMRSFRGAINSFTAMETDYCQPFHLTMADNSINSLSYCCIFGDEHLAEELIRRPGVNINAQDDVVFHRGVLHMTHRPALIEKLLSHPGINVNMRDVDGMTPLLMLLADLQCNRSAKLFNFLHVLKMLLAHPDIDVNAKDNRGQSVLAWTCCQQLAFTEVVEAVLAHPSLNVNDQDEDGDTVLMTVCRNGDSKVAFYLLNHPDIDVNIQNRDGQTALFFAEYQSRKPDAALIAALKEKGEAALLREVVSLTGYASSAAVAYMRSQSTFKGRVSGYFAFKG